MTDIFFSVLFFFVIFCFLMYSCSWFSRTFKRYQSEMERHRQVERARTDCRISVYTIEDGTQRQTIINYNSQIPPPPSYKEELPPNYTEAIKMSILQPSVIQSSNSIENGNTSQNTTQQSRRFSANI